MTSLLRFRAALASVSSSLGRVILRAAQSALLLPAGDHWAGASASANFPLRVALAQAAFHMALAQANRVASGIGVGQFGQGGGHFGGEGNNRFFHAGVVAPHVRAVMGQALPTLTPMVTPC